MNETIVELTKKIEKIKGCQFASLTYLSKSSGELARYTVELGFDYHRLIKRSIVELEILNIREREKWTGLMRYASWCVMESLRKTMEAHGRGEQNDDYTKKGQY